MLRVAMQIDQKKSDRSSIEEKQTRLVEVITSSKIRRPGFQGRVFLWCPEVSRTFVRYFFESFHEDSFLGPNIAGVMVHQRARHHLNSMANIRLKKSMPILDEKRSKSVLRTSRRYPNKCITGVRNKVTITLGHYHSSKSYVHCLCDYCDVARGLD